MGCNDAYAESWIDVSHLIGPAGVFAQNVASTKKR